MGKEKILVIGAHALDFLWRCGGTIAKYTKNNHDVKVINITYGERGESDGVWEMNPDITEREVKEIRKKEAEAASGILGAKLDFLDWSDHLLTVTREQILELSKTIKEYQPSIILTHFTSDTLNFDHPVAANIVLNAVRCAKVSGVFPEIEPLRNVGIYMFEPAQPEFVGFNPNIYIDITDVMEQKCAAMEAISAQEYLISTYRLRANYRGELARKIVHNKKIEFAEAFCRFYPYVGNEFC